MTQPTPLSLPSARDWQLIADAFSVMRDHQCHDDKPGLTAKDVGFFKQSAPQLFNRVVQGISSEQPRDVAPQSFLTLLESVRSNKILPILTKLTKGIFPNVVSSHGGPAFTDDRFYLGSFFIELDKPHERSSDYDKLKNALQTTLTQHGVSLAGYQLFVGYPGHQPGEKNERAAKHWVRVGFSAGLCD